ncbi:hypothetical protein V8G54_006196 [Vigna mungo]|uniref:Uncharacterized protein n=1 Tax=Vigna mungo TaxID=3915 RepID=A0AAQ3S7T5_VIGMU
MVMPFMEGRGGPLICCDSLMSLNEVEPTIEGASSSIAHFCIINSYISSALFITLSFSTINLQNFYLHIRKVHVVLVKKAYKFLEVLFCGVIVTTVWPNSLHCLSNFLHQSLSFCYNNFSACKWIQFL